MVLASCILFHKQNFRGCSHRNQRVSAYYIIYGFCFYTASLGSQLLNLGFVAISFQLQGVSTAIFSVKFAGRDDGFLSAASHVYQPGTW